MLKMQYYKNVLNVSREISQKNLSPSYTTTYKQNFLSGTAVAIILSAAKFKKAY